MEDVYRRFLFFKDFAAPSKPVVVFEGKTDRIYINLAIRNLATKFPELANKSKDGEFSLKIRLYKYSEITRRLLDLSGGSGQLSKFIYVFDKERAKMKLKEKPAPIILLIDNDDGAKDVFKAITSKSGKKVDGSDSYYFCGQNLYVVPTPLGPKGGKSTIEDFFESSVKKIKLGGKVFNPSKKGFDNKKEYGKHLFAEQIVKKNADKIKFDAFAPLLGRIENVIKVHKKSA